MEKLLVAENKSYEAYRTNSNKQALSETPANGLRFARFTIGLLGKYDTFTSKEKTFQLLDEKTPVFMSCSPFTPYDYVDKASTYI